MLFYMFYNSLEKIKNLFFWTELFKKIKTPSLYWKVLKKDPNSPVFIKTAKNIKS